MKVVGIRIIRLIGKFLILRGIWILFHDLRPALFTLQRFPERVQEWGLGVVLLILAIALVVPVCYIIGGTGLFILKRRGRVITFIGLWFNILFALTRIGSKWYFQFVLKSSTVVLSAQHAALINYMNNLYLITLIEVIIVIFLLRPKVRQELK